MEIILNDKQFKEFESILNEPARDNPALRELMKPDYCEWCDKPVVGQVVRDLDDGTCFHLDCAIKDREIELAWEGIEYVTSLPRYLDREGKNLTIDRVNNNKNYERGNIRWATKKEQANNQTRSHSRS